ncbi:MAG TPA: hypothetical protein VJ723_13645 [Candidatus Angelobacter sp.]|nr:hypothetical protein [Candidatus Angelobacter sp.]
MSNVVRFYPYLVIGAAVLALLATALLVRSRRKSPEQRERERRLRISEIGRITDGTVIDVTQLTAKDAAESQLLIFRYDVAGVSYEASQDITHLRHLVDLHSCRLGLPVSIRYDPVNPGNSIVISENWTGLRL